MSSIPDDVLISLAQEDWEGLELICDFISVELNGGVEMGRVLN